MWATLRPLSHLGLGRLGTRASSTSGTTIGRAVAQLTEQLEQGESDRYRTRAELDQLRPVSFGDSAHTRPDLERLRVVPKSRSFYMRTPGHEDIVRRLDQLVQQHINLPTVDAVGWQPPRWPSWQEYQSLVGGKIRLTQYRQFVKLAQRLAQIEPQLIPREVEHALRQLRRDGSATSLSYSSTKKEILLDSEGRAVTVGHRKSASARVWVSKAQDNTSGEIWVNGKSLDEALADPMSRRQIIYPLQVVDGLGEYNVWATVHGGGMTSQAGAVSNALSMALLVHNPLLKPRLRKAGCTKRDIRQKERKKPGLAKARKAYTWVKR